MDLSDLIRWLSKHQWAALIAFVLVSAVWELLSKMIQSAGKAQKRPEIVLPTGRAEPAVRKTSGEVAKLPTAPGRNSSGAASVRPRTESGAKTTSKPSLSMKAMKLKTLNLQPASPSGATIAGSTATASVAAGRAVKPRVLTFLRDRESIRQVIIAHEVMGASRSVSDFSHR